jgi:hypothetical protein
LTLQESLPDADSVEWYPNTYRELCIRYDRRLIQVAVGAGLLALIGLVAVILATAIAGLPSSVLAGGAVLLLLSLSTVGFVGLTFTKQETNRSWYSPLRIGFSSQGIHVTLDSASAKRRRYGESSIAFISWDSIEGVSPPVSPYGPYVHHMVVFNSAQRPPPEIDLISEELMERIKSEVEKHAYDLGPE